MTNTGFSLESIRASRNNPDAAPLACNEIALLKLAIKSIEAPEDVSKAGLDEVHQLGWSKREIFDAVAQVTNNRVFNYILRTFNIEYQGVFG